MSDDPDLFDDGGEGLGPYADAGAADQVQRPDRKRPGRPKGALNRKTKDFERWYQAQGFRDPLEAMGQFLTADPVELQSWFIEHERSNKAIGKGIGQALPSLMDIIKEQHACASQLGPYLHGKKPVEIALIDERLPTLIIDLGTNQLAEGQEIAGRKALSVGQPLVDVTPNEIKDLPEQEE